MEATINRVLATAMDNLEAISAHTTIEQLATELANIYDQTSTKGERNLFATTCQQHALHQYIMKDPYSRRAFEKPGGYAGDAIMLDYIYKPGIPVQSAIGAAIHAATTSLPNAQSILWRRNYLGQLILEVSKNKNGAGVFSVACGHMRELDNIDVPKDTKFCALDQDQKSLLELKKCHPEKNIEYINKPITHLFSAHQDRQFDLVYSAGLFDYLSHRIARKLIRCLYRNLVPGGLLSIGNFTPDSHGRGYMEGLMAWSLIYRDEHDMERMLDGIVPIHEWRKFRDDMNNVVYVEIRKG